jgi:hypothetical protein
MNRAKLIVPLGVCFMVAWCSWLFRYDLKQASSNMPAAYILDRWTGKTYFTVGAGDWWEIKAAQTFTFDEPVGTASRASSPAVPKTQGFTPLETPPASDSPPK